MSKRTSTVLDRHCDLRLDHHLGLRPNPYLDHHLNRRPNQRLGLCQDRHRDQHPERHQERHRLGVAAGLRLDTRRQGRGDFHHI